MSNLITSGIINLEPVAQGRPRFSKRGRFIQVYDPPKSKEFKESVRKLVRKREQLIDTPIEVVYRIYRSIPKSTSKKNVELMEQGVVLPTKKPDWDNYAKGLQDALNGWLWTDDALICDAHVIKRYSTTPRIEYEVRSLA